jgi:hypothetical protein
MLGNCAIYACKRVWRSSIRAPQLNAVEVKGNMDWYVGSVASGSSNGDNDFHKEDGDDA